jgi:hypothetical protein
VRTNQALPLIIVVLSSVASATSGATDQKASEFVLCRNQKTVRTIRVMPEATDSSCSITYSKGGVEELVGANRSLSSCKSILAQIRTNLESSKWNCHSVSKATVTESAELSSGTTSRQ